MSDSRLRITATPNDPDRVGAFARFVWSEDLTDFEAVIVGLEDSEVEALFAAKVHEGARLEGWTVEIL